MFLMSELKECFCITTVGCQTVWSDTTAYHCNITWKVFLFRIEKIQIINCKLGAMWQYCCSSMVIKSLKLGWFNWSFCGSRPVVAQPEETSSIAQKGNCSFFALIWSKDVWIWNSKHSALFRVGEHLQLCTICPGLPLSPSSQGADLFYQQEQGKVWLNKSTNKLLKQTDDNSTIFNFE